MAQKGKLTYQRAKGRSTRAFVEHIEGRIEEFDEAVKISLANFGVDPAFISYDGELPDSEGAEVGTKGAYFKDETKVFQILEWDGDSWVEVGSPIATEGLFLDYVADFDAAVALAEAWAEGTEPGGAGTKSAKKHSEDADARATAAGVSETNAGVSETNAGLSEAKAEKWAEEDEDTQVETGKYSAKHHAAKAAASAGIGTGASFTGGHVTAEATAHITATDTAGASYINKRKTAAMIENLVDAGLYNNLLLGFLRSGGYKVDAGSATNLYDISQYGHNGAPMSAARQPVYADGVLTFDGVDDNISISNTAPLQNATDELTLDIEINPTRFHTNNSSIITKGRAGNTSVGSWALNSYSNNSVRFTVIGSDGSTVLTASAQVPHSSWSRVTVVFKGGDYIKMYVNGALLRDEQIALGMQGVSSNIVMGTDNWGAYPYEGSVGRVLLFDKVLSPGEIAALNKYLDGYEHSHPDFNDLQPHVFSLDGVLDTSKSKGVVLPGTSLSLTHSPGEPDYQDGGVLLTGTKSLSYYFGHDINRVGVGATYIPQENSGDITGSGEDSFRRYITFLGDGSKSASVYWNGGSSRLQCFSSGYTVEHYDYSNYFQFSQGDEIELYCMIENNHMTVYIRGYGEKSGESVRVLSLRTQENIEIRSVHFGWFGGANSANAIITKVALDIPHLNEPEPNKYLGLRVRHEPMLVMTVDDGNASDYTKMYDYMIKRGVRGTSFVITNSVGAAGRVTWSQINEMVGNGWEVACHSHTHPSLTGLTEQQIRDEFENVNAAFEANGLLPPRTHAYPYGDVNQAVRAIASEYRDIMRGTDFEDNSWAPAHGDMTTFGGIDQNSINERKEQLDRTIKNKGILILMLHEITEASEPYFQEFIDYALPRIKFVTMAELLGVLGPRNYQGYYRA
jgi:peptidoglycan/xylan/chitin deacetylase (PgdA/CDA1 family)